MRNVIGCMAGHPFCFLCPLFVFRAVTQPRPPGRLTNRVKWGVAHATGATIGGGEMDKDEQLIEHLYDRFNARDIDAVQSALAEDVAWANGMENTHVHGPEAVRAYWTHQWSVINPHVDPVRISRAADGSIVVDVHQTVHDLDGKLLLDETVGHVFRVAGGRVTRFDIRPGSQLSTIHPAK